MIYYVAGDASDKGRGTKGQPFHTISQAAEIARSGDTVMVAPAFIVNLSILVMAEQMTRRVSPICTIHRGKCH